MQIKIHPKISIDTHLKKLLKNYVFMRELRFTSLTKLKKPLP